MQISFPMPPNPAMICKRPARAAHLAWQPPLSTQKSQQGAQCHAKRRTPTQNSIMKPYSREAQSEVTTTVHAPDAELKIPALPLQYFSIRERCTIKSMNLFSHQRPLTSCQKRAANNPRTTVVQRPTNGETPATIASMISWYYFVKSDTNQSEGCKDALVITRK